MKNLIGAAFLLACSSAAGLAQDVASSFAIPGAPRQLQLANGLLEISGLAVASENSVYAHNDEHAIVYELSLDNGKIVSAFALGDPTVRADFEGIAVFDGRVYLAASNGLIYEAPIGPHRERVRFNIFDTGIGEFCEVEGITNASVHGEFLILCKAPHVKELARRLVIYKWSVNDRKTVAAPWLNITYSTLLTADEREKFRPSAIEQRDKDGLLIILSARNRLLIAVNESGKLIYKKKLPPELHPQAEGVALLPSGDFVIADEGARRMVGTLSIYRTSPQ